MKIHLKALQWLVFLLAVWLPLAGMAASAVPAPNFPSTEPEFETLRDAENVDNRPITALAQDGRGLIWIGTQTGLVRYDGYRFRKFVHKATDPFRKNRYQYRLHGYDKGWINTDSDHRSATFGNLWPGQYTLQVRGSNRMGEWSVHELRIPIQVLPAWWQTWWFGLMVLLGTIGCFAALMQARTSELNQKHTELALSHSELKQTHHHLQETQQQLMLQEKMAGLGTLTAGVAHEINNPTNFVHVSAQLQQSEIAEFEQFVASLIEADGSDGAAEVLQAFNQRFARLSGNVSTMLVGTERIIGIVKDLRAFTRLDESERKTVRLSECLLSTLNLVRTRWQDKVEFITEFTADPELECWPALLNQAFMNLLLNACQAIEQDIEQAIAAKPAHDGVSAHDQPRGKLWLRLRLNPAGNALMIDFEDNGTGIDVAIQGRIMEPFFTTKEVGSGTGLGLSTAFGIVQKHGGSLEFSSSPGQGSCFTITLPLTGK